MMRHPFPYVAALLLVGSACAGTRRSPAAPPSLPAVASDTGTNVPAKAGDTTGIHAWWRSFNAPALDTLATLALQHNADIRLAVARLAEAQATVRGTNANWDPNFSPSASFTRAQQVIGNFGSISTTVASASSSASWELDLFGRLRQERDAATADGIASSYDLADVQRTTSAQVARAFFDVLSASQQVAVLEAQLESRRVSRRLEASRARAGLSARTDSMRADAAEREVMSQLPGIRAQRAEALGDLVTLTGAPLVWVDSVVSATSRVEVSVQVPADGVPVEQLRARPDVRAAEARVVAAAARVKVAQRSLLPSLSLSGNTGRNKTNSNSWVPTWSFGPSLALNLPTRAGRAQVDVRRAQLAQREIEWRQAVSEAAIDVDVAFARVRQFGERLERQRETVAVYRDLAAISRTRWTSGLSDFRDVVDAQRSQLDAERALVEQWTAYAKAVVTLHQAAGRLDGGD